MQPYLGLTVGGGGFDWAYAEEVYEEFPDGFPDDVTTGTGIMYLATQIGADWGPFSMGTRFLLTRHFVTGDDFEARYGRGDYLEFYLALVKRDWHP